MAYFLSIHSSFFFLLILAKWRGCFLFFWFLMLSKILLTVTIQCEGKWHPRKTLHCSRSLAKKIRLLLGFWNSDLISNHVARFPLALLRTGLCWLCIHPLALLRSLHLYHLWSFHGFISTKVLLPETANPRPACSNNFLQFAPSCSLFPTPSVSVFEGEGVGWQGEKESGCTGYHSLPVWCD